MRLPSFSATLLAVFLTTTLSHGAVILDSIGGTNGTLTGELSNDGKAVAFTTGSSAYALDNAVVRLNLPSLTAADTLHAGIFTSTTSGNLKPVTEVTSFTFPAVSTTGAQSLTLTPVSPVILAANTTYFFVLWGTDTANGVGWYYDSSTPASGAGYTFPDVINGGTVQYGLYYDINNPGGNTLTNPNSWFQGSGVYNDLTLNGTLVPEPSAAILVSLLGSGALIRRRR